MHTAQYIRYVNFPTIPESILKSFSSQQLIETYNENIIKNNRKKSIYSTYMWTDELNAEINSWGQKNICSSMYYAFQIITGALQIHKDNVTTTKLNYIITPGGDNVITNFYDEDKETKLASYNIEPFKWHIFKADTYHSVTNIEPGQIRLSITARIFE